MNLNKVVIVGRTTDKPESKMLQSGQEVCSFSMATSRVWNDKNGAKQENTEFHRVVVWGKMAATVAQWVEKGQLILVEGRLQTRTWEGKDGKKNYTTEIVAESVQFGPKSQKDKKVEEKQESALDSFLPDVEEGESVDLPF